jgi:quinol-cytochrome oxidoreductase complex cytochrome b subunit
MSEQRRASSSPRPGVRAPSAAAATSAPAPPAAKKPSGLSHLLLHLHPRMVPADALALPRTFGLGGIALFLFVLLAGTGALLLFVYEPSVTRGYASLVSLQDDVPFGSFVRAIHHWAGNLMLVVVFLHLLRVFYTGAFWPPRRSNWLLGLGMLLLVLAANFTGYLLPWDQLAYWAVTIGTGMLQYVPVAGETLVRLARGGPDIGPRTLSSFFVVHIALLPILLFLCASFHFWLVRKAGGVMVPGAPGGAAARPALVPVQPGLVFREGVAALVVLALVSVLAAVVAAPLGEPANPGLSPNPAKAPWYFMGIQELLVHLHPAFAVLVVPLATFALLAGLPFVRDDASPSGHWFHSERGRRAAVTAAVAALALVPAAVLFDERVLRSAHVWGRLPAVVATGVVPLLVWAAILGALSFLLRRALELTRFETIQSIFTFMTTALLLLTIIGVVFRGPGMRLVWPG